MEALFFCLNYICRMKTGILSILLCLSIQMGFAQVTDTLGYLEFMQGTSTLYESPNGGFAFGQMDTETRPKRSLIQTKVPLCFEKFYFNLER